MSRNGIGDFKVSQLVSGNDICQLDAHSFDAPLECLEDLPATQAWSACTVTRWQGLQSTTADDALAVEIPVALVFNGVSHVVMLASPADLEDFAYGFAYTEGIITHAQQIYGIELKAINQAGQLQGIEVHVALAAECFIALKAQRRNLAGRTGCGLCGAESLQQVFKCPNPATASPPIMHASRVYQAIANLSAIQPLQQVTGATHASALVDVEGHVLCVREDVGRHNALDKLLGAQLRQSKRHQAAQGEPQENLIDWQQRWVLTTSRASYEMVQKVAMAGGRVLVAMSAPTALAVHLAKKYDLCLIGFAKSSQCVAYHGTLIAL